MSIDFPPYYYEYKTNENLDFRDDLEEIYYFAYGSNMDDQQMEFRRVNGVRHLLSYNLWPKEWESLPKTAIFMGRAILKDYRLNFDKQSGIPQFCYASVSPCLNSIVEGVLYKLDKKFIKVLDFYEGVKIYQYTRELLQVFVNDEISFHALIYIAHPSCITEGGLPSKNYLQIIIQGAEKSGLSSEYVAWLEKWRTAD